MLTLPKWLLFDNPEQPKRIPPDGVLQYTECFNVDIMMMMVMITIMINDQSFDSFDEAAQQ